MRKEKEAKVAFPGMKFEEIEADLEEDEDLIFYLWEENLPVYECFKILRNYLDASYVIDSTLLVSLVKEEGYNLKDILTFFPYILSSYLNVILKDSPDGN